MIFLQAGFVMQIAKPPEAKRQQAHHKMDGHKKLRRI